MLRFTAVARKISAFPLFVKEQHASSSRRLSMKAIGQKYRQLPSAQKAALVKRANAYVSPNGTKWKSFLKAHKSQYKDLRSCERMQKLGQMFRQTKVKSASPSKHPKISASRKVKKAAKAKKVAAHRRAH